MVRELGAGVALSSTSRGVRRSPRVTSGQVDALLSYLETSPYLHNRISANPKGRKKIDKWWKEVAEELNQLPNGSIKTAEQWMTVWRDIKSRASNKLARLQNERVQSSNQAGTTAPLTEVERRIVSVLQNSSYISRPALIVQKFAPIVQKPAPVVQKPAPIVQRKISTPNRNLDSSPSVDEHDSSAQQDFLPVAESNAESIRIFADAAKLQAEAAKIQVDTSIMFANAADKIAEAARTQAETSLIIAKTADKIAEALIKISEKLNNN